MPALRERRIAADVTIVDAHSRYYRERSVIDRLRIDIIEPARARGYRQIWLVGISLGGFGALIYTREQPQGISGIVAIAPYLGEDVVAKEIAAQGGLRAWRSQPADGGHDWQPWRAVWQRLLDGMPLAHDASCAVTP